MLTVAFAFQLFFPPLDAGLGTVVLGFGFVTHFDPDAGQAGIDVDVVWIYPVSLFGGLQGFVQLTFGEVDLGECMQGCEVVRVLFEHTVEFFDRSRDIPHREIEGRFFNERLQIVDRIVLMLWHEAGGNGRWSASAQIYGNLIKRNADIDNCKREQGV